MNTDSSQEMELLKRTQNKMVMELKNSVGGVENRQEVY